MGYSFETFSAFSAALAAHYAAPSAAGLPGSPVVSAIQSGEARSDDEAYLVALLESHRGVTSSHAASGPPAAVAFLRLRDLGLTLRECEVLFWIAEGKRDAEIAAILGTASKTVSKHVEHVLAKLHAETRAAAAYAALDWLRRPSDAPRPAA